MAKAKEVNGKEFQAEVLESKVPVLVDFWASWCQPCLMMAPILDELLEDKELKGKIEIAKCNVEEEDNQDVVAQYDILSIPNMKVFKDGQVVKEIVGLRSAEVLKDELLQVIK